MLNVTQQAAVSILELDRAEKRNALNLDLCGHLAAATQAEVDRGARVLVVTGSGSAFCAGADLGGVYGDDFLKALYSMLRGLTELPVPIIAAVNGPAIGAGTQLALACDLRVAEASAKFAVPTPKNGMAVDAWTMRTLEKMAGGGMARRLLIAAETIDRDAATRCGLVDRHGTLDEAVTWAKEIAELAPLALAHNKLTLNGASDADVEASFARCWASDDVAEAARARTEKRAPQFRGR